MKVASILKAKGASVETIRPDTSLYTVVHRVRHLPVVEGGKLCGIVSLGDVVKHRLDELEMEANILREIVIAGR